MKKVKDGVMVVLDGVDGSGKTTITNLVASWLKKKGYDVLHTHEPSEGRYGKQLEMLLHKKTKLSKKEWIALFTKDREEHVAKEIMPALKSGKIVLCERYYYSTLAYQLSQKKWQAYLKNVLKPNLALIFDVPVKTAMKRLEKKYTQGIDTKTVFEKAKKLQRVREKFLLMLSYLKEKIVLIDASKSIEEVFAQAKKEIEKALK